MIGIDKNCKHRTISVSSSPVYLSCAINYIHHQMLPATNISLREYTMFTCNIPLLHSNNTRLFPKCHSVISPCNSSRALRWIPTRKICFFLEIKLSLPTDYPPIESMVPLERLRVHTWSPAWYRNVQRESTIFHYSMHSLWHLRNFVNIFTILLMVKNN